MTNLEYIVNQMGDREIVELVFGTRTDLFLRAGCAFFRWSENKPNIWNNFKEDKRYFRVWLSLPFNPSEWIDE